MLLAERFDRSGKLSVEAAVVAGAEPVEAVA